MQNQIAFKEYNLRKIEYFEATWFMYFFQHFIYCGKWSLLVNRAKKQL